jgi:replicative DNA helicase
MFIMTEIKPNGQQEDIFEAILREHNFTYPFDYNAEIQVVGALLKAPLRLEELHHMLGSNTFYDKWTRVMYENIYKLFQKGETEKINPDVLTLKTNDEHRDRVVHDILNHIHTEHIKTDELTGMIKALNELAFKRSMLNEAFCIMEDAYDTSSPISRKVTYAEEISKKIIHHINDLNKLNGSIS